MKTSFLPDDCIVPNINSFNTTGTIRPILSCCRCSGSCGSRCRLYGRNRVQTFRIAVVSRTCAFAISCFISFTAVGSCLCITSIFIFKLKRDASTMIFSRTYFDLEKWPSLFFQRNNKNHSKICGFLKIPCLQLR